MFGRKKRNEIVKLVQEHGALVGQAVESYQKVIEAYLSGSGDHEQHSRQVDSLEADADRVRVSIENLLYGGGLLPTEREDFVTVLETVDRIANKAEDAGDFITLVRPKLPALVTDDILRITTLTVAAYQTLSGLQAAVLDGDYKIEVAVESIGNAESEIDAIQFRAIRKVFRKSDLERVDKLVALITIDRISHVSDYIENAGDRLLLVAMKRRLK